MHRVAESITTAETLLGLDSKNVDCSVRSSDWEESIGADIFVCHTHIPTEIRKKSPDSKIVWIGHGTPDHVFQSSLEHGSQGGYGHADPLMLMQYWLRNADARVTFWPRHKWIYDRMVDRGTKVHLVPLGVDKAFWSAGVSRGKYEGTPSVFTAENPHYIKHPYDVYIIWPEVFEGLDGAKLHSVYMPRDQHRWVFPLVNANGTSFSAHISPLTFAHDELRNVFKSVDFYLGLVRYGDFNQISLQAGAAGVPTISYAGNDYADYWITEGDQRFMARQLTDILAGTTPARSDKKEVPDLVDTAKGMVSIYEGLT